MNQSNTPTNASENLIRSLGNEKIHYLLAEWQNSENPDEFAKEHDLSFNDGKILVYLYLKDSKTLQELPSEITILSFDGNQVLAFVTSEEIYQIGKLDLIEKITPPERAEKLIVPKIETDNSTNKEKNEQHSKFWILMLIIITIVLVLTFIVILKKIRKI